MAGAENERLVAVETKVDNLSSDVAEIKTDVKGLTLALAEVKTIVDRRSGFADAVRSAAPWLAIVISMFAVVGAK